MKKEIIIEGMSCEHCAKKVEETLKKVNGVNKVKVILNKQTAEIDTSKEIDTREVERLIKDVGYTVKKIK